MLAASLMAQFIQSFFLLTLIVPLLHSHGQHQTHPIHHTWSMYQRSASPKALTARLRPCQTNCIYHNWYGAVMAYHYLQSMFIEACREVLEP